MLDVGVKMVDYHNENDKFCAQWLRNLMAASLIPQGFVDERDIRDVKPMDLWGFDRCHFFSGIGGWVYALRLAGIPDDLPLWTGSCPCQPFSAAGKRKGFADERHLWPAWFHLIGEHRPARIFGEQIAGADGFTWLDLVQADLEGLDYACGATVLPAACVEAPHERHRIFFVAHADGGRRAPGQSAVEAMGPRHPTSASSGESRDTPNTSSDGRGSNGGSEPVEPRSAGRSDSTRIGLPNADGEPMGWAPEPWRERRHWAVEPSMGRVADGIPDRVDKLRALGNSIVPQVAAAFIEAALGDAP